MGNLNNPLSILGLLFHKKTLLKFKSGLSFFAGQALDTLIIKETLFDDAYGVSSISNPRVIIDVGAGLGDFCIFAATRYPKARIIAFEPNPYEFRLLQENIRINKIENIKAHKIAVGTKARQNFFIANYNVKSSVIKDKNSINKIVVKSKALNGFIKSRVDYLKIDCEGAELDVLKSIKKETFKKIRKIVLEYHRHLVKEQDKKIVAVLKDLGYKTKQLGDSYNSDIGYIFGSR